MSSKDLEVRHIISPCNFWFLKRNTFYQGRKKKKKKNILKTHQNVSEGETEVTVGS